MQIADFPHMKSGSRSRLQKQLNKLANLVSNEDAPQLSTDELSNRLRAILG